MASRSAVHAVCVSLSVVSRGRRRKEFATRHATRPAQGNPHTRSTARGQLRIQVRKPVSSEPSDPHGGFCSL
ncbi:hypothetical protein OH77DRAFT_1203968 [Trametes cingulata]|nr:hypothetical protein OH77DRAFT_1203968 [Trametes cingulata]